MSKLVTCPFCKKKYIDKEGLFLHMEDLHKKDLCNLSPKQVYFNFTNRYALTKGFGKSVISGKPTKFNEITGRYERFLPEEKEQYRQYFLANMKRAGKEDIMKDMEHQKMMLANRSISGRYQFRDGTEFTYTGSYERKFLVYLDTILNWPSSDLMAPAPQIFPYKTGDGVEHAHIPDFYISSLNAIINIKSSENKHYRLRDLEVERLEDMSIKKSSFNYIKIYDNKFSDFFNAIEVIRNNTENNIDRKVIIENNMVSDSLDILTESVQQGYETGLDEYLSELCE